MFQSEILRDTVSFVPLSELAALRGVLLLRCELDNWGLVGILPPVEFTYSEAKVSTTGLHTVAILLSQAPCLRLT